jgi:large subunit ribosomal protein L19
MGIFVKHKDVTFGVGDIIKITQKVKEKGKERAQIFEGTLIAIKGSEKERSITVRRIGAQKIGIEKIIPLNSPAIEKVEIIKKGSFGVKQSKLYYLRSKSKREIEKIYSRVSAKKEGK